MAQLSVQEKKAWVLGLLIECPVGNPLETCPAKDARELSFKDRFELANHMTEQQLDDIIQKHRDCLRERERKLFRRDD